MRARHHGRLSSGMNEVRSGTTKRVLRRGNTPGSKEAFQTAPPRIAHRRLPQSANKVSTTSQVGVSQIG
jgi:hypothetical protein